MALFNVFARNDYKKRAMPILILSALFSFATSAVLYFLPIYLLSLVGSSILVGIIIGGAYIWNCITDLILTRIGQGIGFRMLIKVAFLILLFFAGLNLFRIDLTVVIVSLLLLSTAQELFQFSIYRFALASAHKDAYTDLFSSISVASSIGLLLGPIASSYLLSRHYRFVFDLVGFVGVISALLIIFWLDSQKKNDNPYRKSLSFAHEWQIWVKLLRKDVSLFFAFLLFGVFWGVVWFLGPLLSLDILHLGAWAGVLMGAFSLPRLLPKKWFSGFSIVAPTYRVVLAFLLSGFFLLLFTLTTNKYLVLALAFCTATTLQTAYPLVTSLLESTAEEHRDVETEYETSSLLFRNIGYVLGSVIAGTLTAQSFNLTYPFLILSLLFFVVAILFALHAKTRSIFHMLSGEFE